MAFKEFKKHELYKAGTTYDDEEEERKRREKENSNTMENYSSLKRSSMKEVGTAIKERNERRKKQEEQIVNEIKKQVNDVNNDVRKSNPQTVTLPTASTNYRDIIQEDEKEKNDSIMKNMKLLTQEEKNNFIKTGIAGNGELYKATNGKVDDRNRNQKIKDDFIGPIANIGVGLESVLPSVANYEDASAKQLFKLAPEVILRNFTNIDKDSASKISKVVGGLAYEKVGRKSMFNDRLKEDLEAEKEWRNKAIESNINKTSSLASRKIAELAPSLGQNLLPMAVAAAPVPGARLASTALFMTSAGGNYLEDAKQRGMNEDQAFGYATVMGLAEGGSEAVISGQMLSNVKKAFTGKALSDTFLNSLGNEIAENFAQEAVMEPFQEGTAQLIGGKETANWDNIGERTLQAGLDGVLSALMLKGASIGIVSSQNVMNKIENNQTVTEQDITNMINDLKAYDRTGYEETVRGAVEAIKLQMQNQNSIISEETTDQLPTIEQLPVANKENEINIKEQAINEIQNSKIDKENKGAMIEALNNMQEISQKDLQDIKTQIKKIEETSQETVSTKESEILPTARKSFEDIADEAMWNTDYERPTSPLESRNINTIGKETKVNAYQYDNPEVKPYFKEMAQMLQQDIANISSPENKSTLKGGGTKLATTIQAVKTLHNKMGYSYNDILKGLNNIIEDHGQENNALSKKLEIIIDDQLRNGYRNSLGQLVDPNSEYINLINKNTQVNTQIENVAPTVSESLPVVNEKYNVIEQNLVDSAKKYKLEFGRKTLKEIQSALEKRGIKSSFDDSYFSDPNQGAMYLLNKDTGERKIVFNPNANEKTIIQEMAIHELTHDIIASNTEASKILRDQVLAWLEQGKDYKEKYNNLINTYLNIKDTNGKYVYNENQPGFEDMVKEEAIAKTLQYKLGTQEQIQRLVNDNRSNARKIYDWVIEKLQDFKNRNNAEYQFWKEVRNNFEKAFKESEFNPTEDSNRYMMGGIEGLTNMQDTDTQLELYKNYQKAKKLAKKGASNKELWRKTHWIKDATTGKLKFYFSDADMEIIPRNYEIGKEYNLEKILKHDTLFELYPQLRNHKVIIVDMNNSQKGEKHGSYDRYKDLIKLDYKRFNQKQDVEGTLIHEIQHAVQKIEKFSRGANSSWGKEFYEKSPGEKEANFTKNRMLEEKENRVDLSDIIPDYANDKISVLDKMKIALYNYLSDIRNGGEINDIETNIQENNEEDSRSNQYTSRNGHITDIKNSNESSFNLPQNISIKDSQGREIDHDIHTYSTDAYSGQVNMRKEFQDQDGNTIAKIDYNYFDNEINVDLIETNPEYRRKGLATRLVKDLQKDAREEGKKINYGYTSEDGTALLKSIRNNNHKEALNDAIEIQGLEDYTVDELKNSLKNDIRQILDDNGFEDIDIVDIDLHGSRLRGTAKNNSDLDVVVQYNGDAREDTLFDTLNETPLEIDGIKVDINPIQEDIKDYMKRSNEYDQEILSKNKIRYSISTKESELPKVKEGYTRLYRGLNEEYNSNFDKNKLDNVNRYESWTDDYELAKSYGDNVYYIDVPTNQISNSIIDEDSNSETYGDRNLIYKNDKPVGINGKSGNEYMLYTDHDNYKNIQYNKINNNTTVDNQGNQVNSGLSKWANNSKARVDNNGKISENGKLAMVYHTMTDRGAQFNEFNPVGTPYYRFGDQVVNYFTDSQDMSGSYADGDYKKADTKKITNMEELENQVNEINENIKDFYEIKINKNKDNTYTANIEYSKGQGKMFTVIKTELEKLKSSEPSVFNELRNRAMTIKNPYEMFTSNYESDADKYSINPEVNKKVDEFIYKIFNDENTPNTYTAGETARRIQEYLTSKKIGDINFTSKEDLFRNFREKLSKEYPKIGGTNKYQYEGYVNIENPYIVDAEERNWNQVVNESNDFIDELDNRVPQDIKNKLVWLYVKSQNISSDLREQYERYEKIIHSISNDSSLSDDTKNMSHLIRRLGIEETNNLHEGNYNALSVNDWNVIADVLESDGVIGKATASFINNEWKLPEQVKNWIDNEYTKRVGIKTDKGAEYFTTLKDLYKDNAKAYEEFSKYRYPQDYFIEKISGDPNSEDFVDIGNELNDIFEMRSEIVGADQVAQELAQASSVNFSKPELIRLWGTSKTTNDIVKEIIASNKDGKTNYDGIIIKNVYDYGGRSESEKPANLYVTFNSNQFKAKDNINPTSDPDIRYSKNLDFDEYIKNRIGKVDGTKTTLSELRAPKANEVTVAPKVKKGLDPIEISKLTKEEANTTPKIEPKTYAKGNKQSSFVSNIITDSQFLNEDLRQMIGQEDNIKYYKGITNEKTLEKAYKSLQDGGASETMNWFNKNEKNVSAEDVAKGWILLKQYQDAGDYQGAVEVAKKMRNMGTQAGQTVQAYNILSRLTPEGMFYYAQSELSEAFNKMAENKTKNWIDKNKSEFDLTPEETQFIIDKMESIQGVEDERTRKVALAEIQTMLQNKIPPTVGQSIKAWMRISMLFNPKTQIRNVMGNAVILPTNITGDALASLIDSQIAKKTGVRTTGVIDLKNYAKGFGKGLFESYDDFRKGINTRNVEGNRFEIGEGKSFKDKGIGKALNRVDNLLSFMLDAGDRGFYEATFTNSLNNQMILNDTTTVTQDMVDIATQEALQRTWQDNNAYTESVLKIRNILNKANVKGYGLGDVLIPFAKTPANLTKAIVDYSPAGLVKSLVADGRNLRNSLSNGQYTPQLQHKFVQNLGKGMAGSLLYVLGYALAKAGIATGEPDDDKDVKNFMKNSLGINSYSIKIGDKSFTYDWAQPIATPLAIMTNYVKYNKENPDANILEKAINSMNIGTEQLLEQSFMESLNTVLNGNGTTLENLSKSVLDLPARAIPTFSKQIADMVDGTQRSTFEYGKPVESAINSVKAKIPGLSKTLPASVDTLGNEIQKYGGENNLFNVMLNPANVNNKNISKAGEEIYDVYMQTGDSSILPRTAPYYINSKGEKITMTAKQKNEFQKVSGQYVEKSLDSLLSSNDYKNLSDEKKDELIKEIVDDSYAKAKYDVLNIDSKSYEKLRNTLDDISTSTYYDYKIKTEGMTKDAEKEKVLVDSNYTNKEKESLYETYIKDSNDKKYDIIKATGMNIDEYLKYKSTTFESDKKDDGTVKGKTISGSLKDKKYNYINNMNITGVQKKILYGLDYTPSKQDKDVIVNYISTLPGKTKQQKLDMLGQFSWITLYKDGTFKY